MSSYDHVSTVLMQCSPLYSRPDLLKVDLMEVIANYGNFLTSTMSQDGQKFVALDGVIPVHHDGGTKRIQVELHLQNYPDDPPKLFVKQRGKYVLLSSTSRIQLPYLESWDESKSISTLMKHILLYFTKNFPYKEQDIERSIPVVNDPVRDLTLILNKHHKFLVKKSISPASAIFSGKDEVTGVRHEIFLKDIATSDNCLEFIKGKPSMMFESQSMVLQIQCATADIAKIVSACAVKAKYTHTGMLYSKSKHIYVFIRSSEMLRTPLTDKEGNIVVSKAYMETLLEEGKILKSKDNLRTIKFETILGEYLNFKREGIVEVHKPISNLNFQQDNSKSALSDLPANILYQVLILLPPTSLHNCRQVNKKLNDFIKEHIWRSNGSLRLLNQRLDNNWKKKLAHESTHTYNLDFEFPEIFAISDTAVAIHENYKGVQKLAIININNHGIWVIEEPKNDFTTVCIKMNSSLLALYKQRTVEDAVTKVYSINHRKVIFEMEIPHFLDMVIDSTSTDRKLVVLSSAKIRVFLVDTNFEHLSIYQVITTFDSKPVYPSFRNDFLFYAIQSKRTTVVVWRIDENTESVLHHLEILDFEAFAQVTGPRGNIHDILFHDNKFFVVACVEYETEVQSCLIRMIADNGLILRNFYFDDFFEGSFQN